MLGCEGCEGFAGEVMVLDRRRVLGCSMVWRMY